jgi:hypothetical protein
VEENKRTKKKKSVKGEEEGEKLVLGQAERVLRKKLKRETNFSKRCVSFSSSLFSPFTNAFRVVV